MYRRLVILSVIVLAAVCGLSALGYHAIEKWAQGLEGARLGEFAEVAEQIRQDVKRKLDEFMQAEQQRKYTDYLYYYIPDNLANAQQQLPVLRSPLADLWSNSFASGYFQIDTDGSIGTPYYAGDVSQLGTSSVPADEVQRHVANIGLNVKPLFARRSPMSDRETAPLDMNGVPAFASDRMNVNVQTSNAGPIQKGKGAPSKAYQIESLRNENQTTQVISQQRQFVSGNNLAQADWPAAQQAAPPDGQPAAQSNALPTPQPAPTAQAEGRKAQAAAMQQAAPQPPPQPIAVSQEPARQQQPNPSDVVQIRIEPFVPLVVPDPTQTGSIFGAQVFLLRHVQIEDQHLLQGFQLDERRLVAEVEESADRFMREGMAFELPQASRLDANDERQATSDETAYTAILDFGFGDLAVSFREMDPQWIARRIGSLHHIYFAIIATVVAAVGLALVSVWHNMRAQVKLAAKKDDFISAVSHELRTPLTSIRMYAEMLEKNWIKTPDKLVEYYRNMRQESERLSRLVENVLDFARLQKGRKRYTFRLGDVNDCIADVAKMMQPYAEQRGFTIRTDLASIGQMPFDKDAVTQIIVNLIDNAVKYASCATDKTILVRTRAKAGFTMIEVEDHGPGIPHRQRKKVFEEFYRCENAPAGADPRVCPAPQGPAATTGTGLGLTLVKRFAEAHSGYVEIDSARPTGALLRVALATHLPAIA